MKGRVETGQSAPKKVWCTMRKWVDQYWKSGMVPNPPRIAALFFESLVPSRDDNPVLKNRTKPGAQSTGKKSQNRNGFDSGKAKIELCVIRQDIWVNTKVNLTGLDRRKPVRP